MCSSFKYKSEFKCFLHFYLFFFFDIEKKCSPLYETFTASLRQYKNFENFSKLKEHL